MKRKTCIILLLLPLWYSCNWFNNGKGVTLTPYVRDTTDVQSDISFFSMLQHDPSLNYIQIRDQYLAFWNNLSPAERNNRSWEYRDFCRWDYFWSPRVAGLNGSFDSVNAIIMRHYAANPPVSTGGTSANTTTSNNNGPNWTPLGPITMPTGANGVGRVISLAFHPNFDGTFPRGTTPYQGAEGHNTLYAGTRFGGLWKSDNGGATWYNPSRFLLPFGVHDIELAGQNQVYVTSSINNIDGQDHGSMMINRSNDGGQTWFTCGPPFGWYDQVSALANGPQRSVNDIVIHPNWWYTPRSGPRAPTPNTYKLFAASSLGIHQSTDEGLNWRQVFAVNNKNFTNGPREIVINTAWPSQIYLCGIMEYGDMARGYSADTVYASLDEGATWGPWRKIDLYSGTNNTLNLGLPPNQPFDGCIRMNKVMVSHQNGLKMYMLVGLYYMNNLTYTWNGNTMNANNRYKQWLFRSTNGGGTWTPLMQATDEFDLFVPMIIDPLNDNIIYYGNCGGYTSTAISKRLIINANNTVTLQSANMSGVHADIRSLKAKVISGNTGLRTWVMMGTDGGVNMTENGQASNLSWLNITGSGLNIGEFYRISSAQTGPDIIIGGKQDNGSVIYVGSSATWKRFAGGDGMDCKVNPSNPAMGYASDGQNYGGGQMFHRVSINGMNTTASGFNTNSVGGMGEWVYPIIINAQNPNTVLFANTNIWRSPRNGQAAWFSLISAADKPNILPGTSTIYSLAMAPSDSNSIVFCRRWAPDYYTTNHGGSWRELKDPTNQLPTWGESRYAYDPANRNTLYIAITGYLRNADGRPQKVYRVTNLGQPNEQWTNWSEGLTAINHVNCIVYDRETDNVYIGTDDGVYIRNKTGNAWQLYGGAFPMTYVTDLDIRYDTDKLRASTHGRGVWEIVKR